MRYVAVTGGIGSGKSYVCRLLEQRGVRVYDCDAAAKRLLAHDVQLQKDLVCLIGPDVYRDGVLQKKVVADFLLQSEEHKALVNATVHPAVARDFMASGYTWLESAILFESSFDQRVPFRFVVCVTAPCEVRLDRIVQRDGISREMAQAWIDRQMPQEEMVRRSSFEIVNDGATDLTDQINRLFKQINILENGNNISYCR